MVIDEGLKTHFVEGGRCQRHPRTQSSQVSCGEGSLRASIPQTRTQKLQLHPRHQQHQCIHPRPPHQPQCPPLSRTRRLLQWVPMDLTQDSPRLSLQQHFLRGQQQGKGKQQLEQLSYCAPGTS